MPKIVNRKKFLAGLDLSIECPHCHAKLQPAQQQRLDMNGLMRCPLCTKEWTDTAKAQSTS